MFVSIEQASHDLVRGLFFVKNGHVLYLNYALCTLRYSN